MSYFEKKEYQVKQLTATLKAGEQKVYLTNFNQTFWGNSKKVIGFILLGQVEVDPTTGAFIDKNTDLSSFVLNIQQDNTTIAQGLPLAQMHHSDGNFIDKQFYHYDLPKSLYENSSIENIFHKWNQSSVDNTFILGVVFEC